MRQTVAETTGLGPVTIRVRTRIRPGLFDHIAAGTNR
jgi:CO/xanthine dehydrogenase Mo-binding subunit